MIQAILLYMDYLQFHFRWPLQHKISKKLRDEWQIPNK